MDQFECKKDGYLISTDTTKLDIDMIHAFLGERSHWAQGRTRQAVLSSIEHSLCFGLYRSDGEQVGFARVITDRTTFAWVCDVFILESYRGKGLAKWLIKSIIENPDIKGLHRILLESRDAQGLYSKYGGFSPLENPKRLMARIRCDE